MSTIAKTDAVVLRAIKYRETSKIITFYTRQFGKIAGIVKGARQAKNKYGSSLEPMSYVSIVLYKKAGRDIQTISSCDLMKTFRHLREDLDRMSVGMALIELVNIVAHEEEENVPLFTLLVKSLDVLNETQNNPSHVFYFFEIQLAAVLGFRPSFTNCISCGKQVSLDNSVAHTIQFHTSKGGPLCRDCSHVAGQKTTLSGEAVYILNRILNSENGEDIASMAIKQRQKDEIEDFLWMYLRFHVSGMRALKSDKVFSKILAPA